MKFESAPSNNKPKPVIYIPKKPRLILNIGESKKWIGIVWHHSATKDNLVGNDTNAINAYHKSFRINSASVALPQKTKLPDVIYVKYKNGEYYKKSEYDHYFSELKKKESNPADKRRFEPAWMDIGYHGLIESVNDTLVFNWGRPLTMSGAHAGYWEFNEYHLGLCAIANYDLNTVPENMWSFALMVTRTFMDKFEIPSVDVIGHREVYDKIGTPRQKMCPGKNWDMNKFRAEI